MPITVLLIESYELVRAGLHEMLKSAGNIQVIAEAPGGLKGIELILTLKPDVVVLDVNLPDISGLEVTHRLLALNKTIKILALSISRHDIFAVKMLNAGAISYLTQDASKAEFIQALKKTYTGQRYLSPTVASQIVFSQLGNQSHKQGFADLSDRETEVIMMLLRGIEVKQIALNLQIKPKTVHNYRNRAFEKLGINSYMSLMLLVIKEGIIKPDETKLS